ncbi:hypothetical protein Zmor_025300 [Zophobas morio]|uniref:SH3 domain-containing protein n=1 Tax=Zophobas morio TaxID=2755281 RepID=A0AA38M4T7_9CUCU|nr:hypothetical protein Zmor_025300 [Zophobas morio]
MGQKPSSLGGRFGSKTQLPFFWLFRRQETTCHPHPEQPIKFQYKTRRKHVSKEDKNQNRSSGNRSCGDINNIRTLNNLKVHQSNKTVVKNTNVNEIKCKIIKTQNALRAKSEPNLNSERGRDRYKHRRKNCRLSEEWEEGIQQFGYEIQDVDDFLSKATIEKPANIPVVLAFPSVLYQTRIGGYQAEIALPLGMVVNAIFKNQHWLYVQTPHAEEGYVSYAACLPLGIIPPSDNDVPAPCWEKSTDVFPRPSGNMTDTEKLSSKSECSEDVRCYSRRSRNAISTCEEQSVDRLYLKALASARKTKRLRQTLLVINGDYYGKEKNSLHVNKGEVVVLLGTHVKDWFWVRNNEGQEGFIPAVIAGHGFL